MPLQIKNENQKKLADWSNRYSLSQNEIVNLIVSAVDNLILEDMVIERKQGNPPAPRSVKIRKVATWGI